jgi:hypothetical protein
LHDVVGTCDGMVVYRRCDPSWLLQENHAVFPAWEGGMGMAWRTVRFTVFSCPVVFDMIVLTLSGGCWSGEES